MRFSGGFGPPGGENFGDLDTFATNPPPCFATLNNKGGLVARITTDRGLHPPQCTNQLNAGGNVFVSLNVLNIIESVTIIECSLRGIIATFFTINQQ